ncbi:uncharacterized protein LOC115691859 [Syzygium oleosum]|uniref:uncharacterized protein LOC115691859 n=1 Tax=Syzygium oleosum TaxID=219896 RepID=UPI0024B96C48|nr:uncharacterized protein LOC115691859 [Syzygium oleosum]
MRIVRNNMEKAKVEILSYKSSMVVTNDASDDNDNEVSLCDISVLDPLQRKEKETNYGRLKSSSEKKKKNSKKGTPQRELCNVELIVQATHNETHFPNYSSNSDQFRNAFYTSNIGNPTVNLNFHNQMQQPPYIMPSEIMNEFCLFPSQIQSPYIMSPGIINGFSSFTSEMLEYHNRSHRTISS